VLLLLLQKQKQLDRQQRQHSDINVLTCGVVLAKHVN
jgi:hypothetical protein